MFSIRVLKDDRIIIIAEQRPDCSEEEVQKYAKMLNSVLKSFSFSFCSMQAIIRKIQ